jgi:choline dehydrogenase-like flavoprotein
VSQKSNVLCFDGKDNHVVLPTDNTDYSQGFTVEAWVWYGSFEQYWSRIVEFGNGPGQKNIVLGHAGKSNSLGFHLVGTSTGAYVFEVPNSLEIGKWTHVAATINKSGEAKLYKNGKLLQTKPFRLPDNVVRKLNYIGKSSWSNDGYFEGKMAEVRLWNIARTPEEIEQNMNRRLSGSEAGLVAYYPLNGDANDKTKNAKHGAILGATWQKEELPIQEPNVNQNQTTTTTTFITPDRLLPKYDVVIVGAGVAGAIVAKRLSQQGKTVLILEAGEAKDLTLSGFQHYLDTFYGSTEKHPNSPYPENHYVQSPMDDNGYFVEKGPMTLGGSYTRVLGGTTMHWEAKTPRMLPNDFKTKSLYGQGLDWPISYDDLMPYYQQAEYEIGVSGDVEEQKSLGLKFEDGYVFPMEKMPPSFLDQKVIEKVDGTKVQVCGETVELKFSTFPQGRNGIPNPKYDQGNLFVPQGVSSVTPVQYGERCQGNANCVPICPAQAKYDARRTLARALETGRVHILPKAVAFHINYNHENGRIESIEYKYYGNEKTGSIDSPLKVEGTLFVLAANAVENARLMLSCNLPNTSDMIGRHLMDHPFVLAWALMPEVTGTMRGPLVTSGIGTLRDGTFRAKQSGFAMDIHNDGWGWATGSPDTELFDAVDHKNKYGAELRETLINRISRQLLLAFMCEMPPDISNRVTIDPKYKDKLGNYRPVINYNLPDYSLRTLAYTRKVSRLMFQRLGAEDYTHYDPKDPGYFEFEGSGYVYKGGNHFSGTHIMGTTPQNSVVDQNLKSWDHPNLYLVGSGSMPTIGTSNTTVTIAALTFKAAEQMLKEL